MRKRYRLNNQIKASKVRVISPSGKNLGVLSIKEALKKAWDKNLDLIEVAPQASPPVCKIADFKKFLFKERQKRQKAKAHRPELKEFRFGPNISPHDLNQRIKRARKFLEGKDRVKITIQFKGREITHPEIGKEKLERMLRELENISKMDAEPKIKGKFLSVTLVPK